VEQTRLPDPKTECFEIKKRLSVSTHINYEPLISNIVRLTYWNAMSLFSDATLTFIVMISFRCCFCCCVLCVTRWNKILNSTSFDFSCAGFFLLLLNGSHFPIYYLEAKKMPSKCSLFLLLRVLICLKRLYLQKNTYKHHSILFIVL
jgi:hypothetical protein